jgi:flavin-dependent dehydrogenase
MRPRPAYDVAILGGGLAGLTLARQLHLERPELRTIVFEKRRHPVPEAAHKVGESSVEIGAHYFGAVLGLKSYMEDQQLMKFGLRYFFSDGSNRDLGRRFELGARRFPRVYSFQIDRGRLENHLLADNRERGIEIHDGTTITAIELGDPLHRITFSEGSASHTIEARWVVDASGRAGLLKRQLGLRRSSGHKANAAWWRVSTRVKLDDWVSDRAWQERVGDSRNRWLSTNHLMGPGYWFWLIPLASDSTSLGIVGDADMHPYQTLNRLDKAYAWLDTHEPQAAEIIRAVDDKVEDFLGLQHFAHGCAQVFSEARWCLTGEAGVFTDPFYSPGSDFIGIGNSMIAELILSERDGRDIRRQAVLLNRFYLALFDAYIKVYEGQYPIMGSARVMSAKVAWDNACYWGITALLFFNRKYRDTGFLVSIEPLMRRFFQLHVAMQAFLRQWYHEDQTRLTGGFANVVGNAWLGQLQNDLDAPHDEASLRRQIETNFGLLEQLAERLRALPSSPVDQLDAETIIPSLAVNA